MAFRSSKGQLLNIEDISSPQLTPEASFDGNATIDSISQNPEKSILFQNSHIDSDSIYCIENHTERNRYDTLYGKKRRFDL